MAAQNIFPFGCAADAMTAAFSFTSRSPLAHHLAAWTFELFLLAIG
jgi:hypothetical protein